MCFSPPGIAVFLSWPAAHQPGVYVTLASNAELEMEFKMGKAKKPDTILARESDIYSEWK